MVSMNGKLKNACNEFRFNFPYNFFYARSEELVQQIMKERQLCVQLKTDIRIREIKAAVL